MLRRLALLAALGCLMVGLAQPALAVPATPVVNCGGGASLQEAIDAALPGDVLTVRGRCIGTFMIDKALTLKAGPGGATLDADGGATALTIPHGTDPGATAVVNLTGLTITGGSVAGLWNDRNAAELTLQNVTVSGNTGRGIANETYFGGLGGVITLRHSNVSDNGAGGIYLFHGSLRLFNSTVGGNTGFGISGWEQASIGLDHSTVSDTLGPGIRNSNSSVTLDESTVRDNTAGGIWTATPLYYLTVRRSTIAGNTADYGGGIYLAVHDPDRQVVIEDSSIRGNTANISGGGIFNAGGPLAITNVKFRNNSPEDCVGC